MYEGQAAPLFVSETDSGEALDLGELAGKVVLVDFWASWCGPCVAEMGTLKKARRRYAERGFEIVGLSFDADAEAMRRFAKREGLTWPLVWLEDRDESEIAKLYGVSGVPATFLIGRDGRVVGKDLRGRKLLRAIRNALDAPRDPAALRQAAKRE